MILGASRRDGNTRALVDAVFPHAAPARVIDLGDYRIGPYDYGYRHSADDFLPLARDMARSGAVVFASPVYWYSMSAQMKTFFDRLSDLTGPEKSVGKSLRGKWMFALATSGQKAAPQSFEAPFADTAGYFGMNWGGLLHACFAKTGVTTPEIDVAAAVFADRIGKALVKLENENV